MMIVGGNESKKETMQRRCQRLLSKAAPINSHSILSLVDQSATSLKKLQGKLKARELTS